MGIGLLDPPLNSRQKQEVFVCSKSDVKVIDFVWLFSYLLLRFSEISISMKAILEKKCIITIHQYTFFLNEKPHYKKL